MSGDRADRRGVGELIVGDRAQQRLVDMMRTVTKEDGPAVVDLVVAAGMFTRDEAAFLGDALTANETTCLVEDADDGGGLAYILLYRPEEAADRAYDLTMIAVRPDLQGQGRGTADQLDLTDVLCHGCSPPM